MSVLFDDTFEGIQEIGVDVPRFYRTIDPDQDVPPAHRMLVEVNVRAYLTIEYTPREEATGNSPGAEQSVQVLVRSLEIDGPMGCELTCPHPAQLHAELTERVVADYLDSNSELDIQSKAGGDE
jgi:hypothetical protein